MDVTTTFATHDIWTWWLALYLYCGGLGAATLTTTFLTDSGIPLELPEAASGQNESVKEEMSVRVARDGGLRFQGEMVSLDDLHTILVEAVKKAPGEALTIYGDGQVDYETVIQVMDVARRAKVPGIVLATEKPLTQE